VPPTFDPVILPGCVHSVHNRVRHPVFHVVPLTRRGRFTVKLLPDGEPVQLTHDDLNKRGSPKFSPDGTRIAYAALKPGSAWNTWIVSIVGGQPRLSMVNASKDLVANHEKDVRPYRPAPSPALLEGPEQRGLLDSTLVIWAASSGGTTHVARRQRTGPTRTGSPCGSPRRLEGGRVVGETDEQGCAVSASGIPCATSMRLSAVAGHGSESVVVLHNGGMRS